MAHLTDKPFPPGRYPLVVVGSGPGAMQLTYCLGRLGVEHAVISADDAPGGMFRRWPIFQRMLSWTKPFANHEKATRAYERFDWNSLLSDDEQLRAIMPSVMDGTSYFPSRPEMEKGLTTFAQKAGLRVRHAGRASGDPRRGARVAGSQPSGSRPTREPLRHRRDVALPADAPSRHAGSPGAPGSRVHRRSEPHRYGLALARNGHGRL